jgi:hypothetical protein
MLAAVIRCELIRNAIGNDELVLYPPGGGLPVYEVPDPVVLRRLRDAGLISLPEGRGIRYWEITDKALEA